MRIDLSRHEIVDPALGETCIAALDEEGYVVLENALDARQLAALRADVEPWFEATPRSEGPFYGYNTTRFGRLLVKSAVSQDMVLNPLLLTLARHYLEPASGWFKLNVTQAIRIHPGEREQVPHKDELIYGVNDTGHQRILYVMWAVDEFTAENGATRIWPGSHLTPFDPANIPEESILAEMPAGSALVFLGSMLHCGGANRSSRPRTGIVTGYCEGCLEQYENAFLSYPPEVAKTFPVELQELIGYRIGANNLNNVEMRDPRIVFDGELAPVAARDHLRPEDIALIEHYYASRTAA